MKKILLILFLVPAMAQAQHVEIGLSGGIYENGLSKQNQGNTTQSRDTHIKPLISANIGYNVIRYLQVGIMAEREQQSFIYSQKPTEVFYMTDGGIATQLYLKGKYRIGASEPYVSIGYGLLRGGESYFKEEGIDTKKDASQKGNFMSFNAGNTFMIIKHVGITLNIMAEYYSYPSSYKYWGYGMTAGLKVFI